MLRSFVFLPLLVLIAACGSESARNGPDDAAQQAAASALGLQVAETAAGINQAVPEPQTAVTVSSTDGASPAAEAIPSPFAIRAQVLLARLRFSPGVVDGQLGSNLKHAVAAYQSARALPVSGEIDRQTWQAMSAEQGAGLAVARGYVLTAADAAGPYAADVGEDMVKLAASPAGPQFTSAVEALAERFHMSQDLLRALNPGVSFAVAGEQIVVVDDPAPPFAKGEVDRIDISKAKASALVYDKAGKLIAFYPATVGSSERPSPSGMHKVKGVAWNTDYTYDPAKLDWGPRSAGKLVIGPGPNNPVGRVWIDLDAPSYGIHGTPEPDKIGKTGSHGCVRLTNWDAIALAGGVRTGTVVRFIGKRGG